MEDYEGPGQDILPAISGVHPIRGLPAAPLQELQPGHLRPRLPDPPLLVAQKQQPPVEGSFRGGELQP